MSVRLPIERITSDDVLRRTEEKDGVAALGSLIGLIASVLNQVIDEVNELREVLPPDRETERS